MKKQIALLIFIILNLTTFSDNMKGVSLDRKEKVYKLSSLYSESYALVIGISQYNDWPKLKNASQDAENIASLLTTNGFKTTLINDSSKIKPTKSNILNALSDLKKIGENARILIYFSGHGQSEEIPYKKGYYKGYIVPQDAKKKSENDYISMEIIKDITIMCKAKHILYFFDSCFSGHFVDVSTRSAQQDFKIIESKTMSPVRMAISAGTANQEVSDGKFHSPMADSLISMLTTNEGDYNDDGFISGEEAAFYIKQKVEAETFGSQTPESGKMLGFKEGDFILRQVKENSAPLFTSDKDIGLIEGIKKGENEKLQPQSVAPQEKSDIQTVKISPFSLSAGVAVNKLKELDFSGLNADKFETDKNNNLSFFVTSSYYNISTGINSSFDFKNIDLGLGYSFPVNLTSTIYFSPGVIVSSSLSHAQLSTKYGTSANLKEYPVGSKLDVNYFASSFLVSGKFGYRLSDSLSIVSEIQYPVYQALLTKNIKISNNSTSDFIKIDDFTFMPKQNLSLLLALSYNF